MGAIPQFEERGQATAAVAKQTKESCWNCYKLFTVGKEGVRDEETKRAFCQQSCYDKHLVASKQTCALESCKKEFQKVNGHFLLSKWFCSESCQTKDPEMQKLQKDMENSAAMPPAEKHIPDSELGLDDDDDEDYEIDL